MQIAVIRALLGLLLLCFSITMLSPILVAWIYGEQTYSDFLIGFLVTAITGATLLLTGDRQGDLTRARDGFLITALFWMVLGTFGSVPLMLSSDLNISITDAVFESISGLTTTGATVISGLDDLPKSLLYYRQQLQWLGGIGIIVIAVAILPMLGIGGMQLYRAETPGPMKDQKLTPRIAGTAKVLFSIYLLMTIACAIAYKIAGMNWFDAICHSYSTIAIGGFSTHDASMGYWNNSAILWVGIVFMLLAAVNFGLHYLAFKRRSLTSYLKDVELRFFSVVMLFGVLVVCGMLYYYFFNSENLAYYDKTSSYIIEQLTHGVFQTVSIVTTTGFASLEYTSLYSAASVALLFFLAFMGACSGSTGGGMKAIRVLLILKQGYRELKRLIHPNAVIPIKLGNKAVDDKVINGVWSFFAIYIASFLLLFLAVLLTGTDFETGFSAVAASINNLGPGLGDVALNYSSLEDSTKWILCFAMLLGRLEVFTLLVLFIPEFWKS